MASVRLSSQGRPCGGLSSGRATLRFAGKQVLQTVRAEGGVRLAQQKSTGAVVTASATSSATTKSKTGASDTQDLELTAQTMDFIGKERTPSRKSWKQAGTPQIVIAQASVHQKTVVTAGKLRLVSRIRIGCPTCTAHPMRNYPATGSQTGPPLHQPDPRYRLSTDRWDCIHHAVG